MTGNLARRSLIWTVLTNLFHQLFGSSARNWIRNVSGSAPALGSMTLLLVMTGLVGMLGFALHNLENVEVGQASLLHVYLRDDANSSDIDALWNRLATNPRVSSVTFTSKDQALARAQRIPGLPQLADAAGSNPFPASLDVQVRNVSDVGAIDALAKNDGASIVDPVYPTSYDANAYQRIQALMLGIAVASLAFLGLLGFVAVAVTMNSIKAAIHARRDEIAIMQLVGAPRWMVRGPFVVEGAITGGVAGGIAGLITFGLTAAAIAAGSGTFSQFAPGVDATTALIAAGAVLAGGLGLGSGSSLMSLRRHIES